MRISDWSSDVCSADLCAPPGVALSREEAASILSRMAVIGISGRPGQWFGVTYDTEAGLPANYVGRTDPAAVRIATGGSLTADLGAAKFPFRLAVQFPVGYCNGDSSRDRKSTRLNYRHS